MDINCKVKLKLQLDMDSRYISTGNKLLAHIKYKINDDYFYKDKLEITIVDDNYKPFGSIYRKDIKSLEQVIKESEDWINDMDKLKEKIKEEVIEDITVNHKKEMDKELAKKEQRKVQATTFTMNFKFDNK